MPATGKFSVEQLGKIVETLIDGEPCFIILAHDNAAVAALHDYLEESKRVGGLNLGRVRKAIDRFYEWKKNNPEKVKVPD